MQLALFAIKHHAITLYSRNSGVILKPVLWIVGDQVDVPEPIIVFT